MITILHLEDSKIDHDLIRVNLQIISNDLDFALAASADDAMQQLEEREFDCILSDFQLPGMDGMTFLKKLRESGKTIPFIFVTGQGSEQVAAEALRSGANDYFSKDMAIAHYERIVNSIKNVIETSKIYQQHLLSQEALRKSEAKLQLLFEKVPCVLYHCTAEKEWPMIVVSPFMEELTGYPSSDFINCRVRSYASIIHPDDRKMVEDEVYKAIEEHRKFTLDYRIIHADGSIRNVFEEGIAVYDDNDKVQYLDGYMVDTTARKQAEEKLVVSQFTLERASDAVMWSNNEARFIFVNDAACSSLGYSRDELLSMAVYDIDPDYPKERWPEHWQEIRSKGSLTIKTQHQTKTGELIPVSITTNYIEINGNEYNCAFIRDMSGHVET